MARLTGGLVLPPQAYKKGAKMIRKFIFVVLALVLMSQVVSAAPWDLNDEKRVIVNTTGVGITTFIPTTIIRPNKDRVFKITVSSALPAGFTSTENFAALYDCTTAAGTLISALEGEIESSSAANVDLEWKRPLRIFNGVTILQGAYTVVLIEWEKVTP